MTAMLRAALVGLAVTAFAGGAWARPVVPAEQRYWGYSGELPNCDNPNVLDRIKDRFEQRESEYWSTSLTIVSYDSIRLIASRPWGLDHIPRIYCSARALLNDQSYHQVSYTIGEDLGMIGMDYGVEWCVQGLDRNLAYAPNCQLTRP